MRAINERIFCFKWTFFGSNFCNFKCTYGIYFNVHNVHNLTFVLKRNDLFKYSSAHNQSLLNWTKHWILIVTPKNWFSWPVIRRVSMRTRPYCRLARSKSRRDSRYVCLCSANRRGFWLQRMLVLVLVMESPSLGPGPCSASTPTPMIGCSSSFPLLG